MASDFTSIQTIRSNALRRIMELQSLPLKPSYNIDGQSVDHVGLQKLIGEFQKTVEWCNQQEAAFQSFEFTSQAIT